MSSTLNTSKDIIGVEGTLDCEGAGQVSCKLLEQVRVEAKIRVY